MPLILALLSLTGLGMSVWQLEMARAGVEIVRKDLPDGPVTYYLPQQTADGPLVVVAHGFAGSRQMMEALSLTLAKSGLRVAAFDFIGHGRNLAPLSPRVTELDGTTQQLVEQTSAITGGIRNDLGHEGAVALLGHSMATDIIVRAAQDMPDVASIVAISMYSDAVTDSFPARLLVVSGEWEPRLREIAVEKLRLLDPSAEEGSTVRQNGLERRVVFAPLVEHVGVLYSPTSLLEVRNWILGEPAGTGSGKNTLTRTGPWILLGLACVTALFFPISKWALPRREVERKPVTRRLFVQAALLPLPLAVTAALFVPVPIAGLAGFGQITAFFLVWGCIQLFLLRRHLPKVTGQDLAAALLLAAWGLGGFAFIMDTYAAAFVPSGVRVIVMCVLALGTLPFMVAERVLVQNAPVWRRITVRLIVLVALGSAMSFGAGQFGVAFTVLPVLLLFWLVYGTMGHFAAGRGAVFGTGIGLGVCLAWAIAASTPMFSAA